MLKTMLVEETATEIIRVQFIKLFQLYCVQTLIIGIYYTEKKKKELLADFQSKSGKLSS